MDDRKLDLRLRNIEDYYKDMQECREDTKSETIVETSKYGGRIKRREGRRQDDFGLKKNAKNFNENKDIKEDFNQDKGESTNSKIGKELGKDYK